VCRFTADRRLFGGDVTFGMPTFYAARMPADWRQIPTKLQTDLLKSAEAKAKLLAAMEAHKSTWVMVEVRHLFNVSDDSNAAFEVVFLPPSPIQPPVECGEAPVSPPHSRTRGRGTGNFAPILFDEPEFFRDKESERWEGERLAWKLLRKAIKKSRKEDRDKKIAESTALAHGKEVEARVTQLMEDRMASESTDREWAILMSPQPSLVATLESPALPASALEEYAIDDSRDDQTPLDDDLPGVPKDVADRLRSRPIWPFESATFDLHGRLQRWDSKPPGYLTLTEYALLRREIVEQYAMRAKAKLAPVASEESKK
jgi:hypothetical protein